MTADELARVTAERDAAVAALARVEALADEARPQLSLPPADCTNVCMEDACNCSGIYRPRAWDISPDAIRGALADPEGDAGGEVAPGVSAGQSHD